MIPPISWSLLVPKITKCGDPLILFTNASFYIWRFLLIELQWWLGHFMFCPVKGLNKFGHGVKGRECTFLVLIQTTLKSYKLKSLNPIKRQGTSPHFLNQMVKNWDSNFLWSVPFLFHLFWTIIRRPHWAE